MEFNLLFLLFLELDESRLFDGAEKTSLSESIMSISQGKKKKTQQLRGVTCRSLVRHEVSDSSHLTLKLNYLKIGGVPTPQ